MARRKARSYTTPVLVTAMVGVILLGFILKQALPITSPSTRSMYSSLYPTPFDFGNQTITLDNQQLTFVNNDYTSSDKTASAMFTNESLSPSKTRAGAILVSAPGESGTFFYIVGALSKNGKEMYSKPILIADRVIISSVTVSDPINHDNGEIIVNFLSQAKDAPLSSDPTEKTIRKYAFQEDGNLIEILH